MSEKGENTKGVKPNVILSKRTTIPCGGGKSAKPTEEKRVPKKKKRLVVNAASFQGEARLQLKKGGISAAQKERNH